MGKVDRDKLERRLARAELALCNLAIEYVIEVAKSSAGMESSRAKDLALWISICSEQVDSMSLRLHGENPWKQHRSASGLQVGEA